ncbi:MAG TPA: flippase [Rhodobiaceae bacterium]|nr:flippase [Rhodobiaceae bacterium]|tara:strand:- start:5958 stop:7310 length:1353 start_codon:yes stop_codon:yes gene_type:complete
MKNSPASTLQLESLVSISVRIISTLLAFAISIVLSRLLGADGFGEYTFALTVTMLVAVPLHTGLSHLSVREVAARSKDLRDGWGRQLLSWTDRLAWSYFAFAAIFFGAAWLLMDAFNMRVNERILLAIAAGLVLVLTMPLTASRSSVLRGLGFANLGQLADSILRPGILALFLLLLSVCKFGSEVSPTSIMLLHGASGLIALLVSVILLKKIVPITGTQPDGRGNAEWTRALWPFYSVAALQLLNSSIDVIALGALQPSEQVGIYKIAAQLGALTSFGLMAINPILHGRFSRLYAANQIDKLQNDVSRSLIYISALAAPPAFILLAFGEPLLAWAYGEEFAKGYLALQIIVLGQMANVGFGAVAALLNMTGHERDTIFAMIAAAIANLLLNIMLIPYFGLVGAAIANAISIFLWNVILWVRVRQRINIESSVWGLVSLLIAKISTKRGHQ